MLFTDGMWEKSTLNFGSFLTRFSPEIKRKNKIVEWMESKASFNDGKILVAIRIFMLFIVCR